MLHLAGRFPERHCLRICNVCNNLPSRDLLSIACLRYATSCFAASAPALHNRTGTFPVTSVSSSQASPASTLDTEPTPVASLKLHMQTRWRVNLTHSFSSAHTLNSCCTCCSSSTHLSHTTQTHTPARHSTTECTKGNATVVLQHVLDRRLASLPAKPAPCSQASPNLGAPRDQKRGSQQACIGFASEMSRELYAAT